MGDQKVDLIKKTYSKTEYSKVIDTKFSQLGVVSLNEQIENTVTVLHSGEDQAEQSPV